MFRKLLSRVKNKDNYITDLYKNSETYNNHHSGKYETIWPKLPNSESLTRQMENSEMKVKITNNLQLNEDKFKNEMHDGEKIIEMAGSKQNTKF